ncbi:MAG: Long-chain-fatty-acid--CoA ligase [Syntrophus sp. SKADARSKE-3]|nr:Long-chain-fatty-acid--CoA ligase [Syntrophus sp. SKADARSKE-3]
MTPGEFNISDMISRNARWYGDKEAVVFNGRRTTFGAYQELCAQYAAGLTDAGMKKGDRIAVLSGNDDQILLLCGAAALTGAVVVPINTRLTAEEVAYILEDTNPKFIVSGREYEDLARKASAASPSIRQHYTFNDKVGESDNLPFKTLQMEGSCRPALAVSGEDDFMIIHTAAVQGEPRGTVLSQGNLIAAGIQIMQLLSLDSSDCHVCILPLFHIGGMAMTVATMLQGGKTAIAERFDPSQVLNLLENERGTFLVTFPPMLAAILDAQEKRSADTSTLRLVCGVDSPETIERLKRQNPHAAFFSLYGQTEAMPVSGGHSIERPGSIGRPAVLSQVALFDDRDREVPAEALGEICVRSPAVFRRYWNLEEETTYTFRNGWHHTGDLGRMDGDGYLWYGGRKPDKELIKPGGENVYPAEVEKVILDHGAIEEVCVIGVPDATWGEAVKAVCVLKKVHTASDDEIIDFVASRIARYKKPKTVVFVDSLPKTASGLINREEVKKIHIKEKNPC